MDITPNHRQHRSLEKIRLKILNDTFEVLYYSMGMAERGTKAVSMTTLPNGRKAQVFVMIETNPDKFI